MTLAELIEETTQTATNAGHELGKWLRNDFFGGSASAVCSKCGRYASVMVVPPKNAEQMGGSALSDTCPGRREQ